MDVTAKTFRYLDDEEVAARTGPQGRQGGQEMKIALALAVALLLALARARSSAT